MVMNAVVVFVILGLVLQLGWLVLTGVRPAAAFACACSGGGGGVCDAEVVAFAGLAGVLVEWYGGGCDDGGRVVAS